MTILKAPGFLRREIVPQFAPGGTGKEPAAHADPAVNAPPFDGHAGFCKCLLPCKNVSVDRIDKSSVEVKDQSFHIYLQ